ncbi:hypothetical protein [Paramicrobacterium chengjingii]|uniref:Scaffolding protein n=1 Tax=Paramicrobacterium chengjingii TaxID=2769067 RepID=A0ABX6YL82_9MICO|nr:hypothetical protein [Microbacterium chengjingii]QPZ39531.1 hypothetical protein HCR76_05600 [Microbacterium chengjingii]
MSTETVATDDVSQTDATTEGVVSNATPEPGEQNEPEQTEDTQTPEELAKADASRYRHRLRDTEAERDTLAGQLKTARGNIVEHMLSNSPATLDALTAAGYEIDSLLDDDGNIDQGKLDEAAQATCKRFNINFSRPSSHAMSRANRVRLEPEPDFANAFTPKAR